MEPQSDVGDLRRHHEAIKNEALVSADDWLAQCGFVDSWLGPRVGVR